MTTILMIRGRRAARAVDPLRLLDPPIRPSTTTRQIIADLAAALGLDGAGLADIAVLPLVAQRLFGH